MSIIITHTASSTLAGKEQRFEKDVVKLGRRPDNDVIFDVEKDRAVSGHHAELTLTMGVLQIRDVGSTSGTFLNQTKVSGSVTVNAGDTIRLGEGGPELRAVAVASGSPAPGPAYVATMAGPPSGEKKTIGINTLEKAISAASVRERSSGRKVLVMSLLVVVVLVGAAIGMFYNHQSQENARLAEEQRKAQIGIEATDRKATDAQQKAAEATALATQIGQKLDEKVASTMGTFQKELAAVQGKLSEGEGRVAKLIVEIQSRDEALDAIRERQDLSEEQRQELIDETEAKVKKLQAELSAGQAKLREEAKKAGGPIWADLVEKYQDSIFLVVTASKPNEEGASSIAIGTAFCVKSNGLLATNSHVVHTHMEWTEADNLGASFVVQNHTGKIFDVRDVIQHDEYNGSPDSPDVALIRINPQGTSFTALPLATDEQLRRLRIGSQLGTMGYPGELMQVYLSGIDLRHRSAPTGQATFKDGWIGRITNFESEAADFAESYQIQHSASLSGGTSGSPMFTGDGIVVGLNNAGIDYMVKVDKGNDTETVRTPSAAQLGYAVRVDLLRDLIESSGW